MRDEYKAIGSFATLGLEVVLCMLVGWFGGHLLDNKFDSGPILAIVGFGFGLAAAVKAIVRAWREMQKATEKEEREQGNPAPMYEPPQRDDRDGEDRDEAPIEEHDVRNP